MSTPREIELKLECEAPDLTALLGHPLLQSPEHKTEFLETTYYDTGDRDLRAAKLALRLRRKGERFVQTLKAAAPAAIGLFDRPEWEWELPGPVLDLGLLRDTPAHAILAKAEPEPLFRTVVERVVRPIAYRGSRITATLDAGRAETAKGDAPFCEVELELEDGVPADLFALARELSVGVPLHLGALSKAERGHALIEERLWLPSKAEAPVLNAQGTAGEAFVRIAQGCLRHLRLNEAVFLHRSDPEALHQMRVALRRLRSAFTLFRPMLRDEAEAERLRAEIKRVAEPFGTARNLDVFLGEMLAEEITRRPDEPGLHDLRERLEGERDRAYAAVLDILRGRDWRGLQLDLVTWIEVGAWHGAAACAGARDRPANAFAAQVLDRFRRRVKTRGRDLAALTPEARHRLRIEAKKLRYGAEFFGSLFPGRKAAKRGKALSDALSDLQDRLGALNDLATAHTIADRLAAAYDGNDGGRPTGAALFATGLAAADAEARAGDLSGKAEKAYDAFRALTPFWR